MYTLRSKIRNGGLRRDTRLSFLYLLRERDGSLRYFLLDSPPFPRCKRRLVPLKIHDRGRRGEGLFWDPFNPILGRMRSFRDCTISELFAASMSTRFYKLPLDVSPMSVFYLISRIEEYSLTNFTSPLPLSIDRFSLTNVSKRYRTRFLSPEEIPNSAIPLISLDSIYGITTHVRCTILAYFTIYNPRPRNPTFLHD